MRFGALVDLDREALIRFFEVEIPFNRLLGMHVVALEKGEHGLGFCKVEIPYKSDLVGDVFRPALHGGVLSALADTAGGLAVFAGVGTIKSRVSTVDLRVDYYEPAGMEGVLAVAEVVRLGNRVGVARIQLLQGSRMVAEGKGVYNIKKPSS